MLREQPGKVQLAPIHDVERPGFKRQDVKHVNVPHLGVADAIEMDADAVDIGKMIHPHPTLGESIGMASEVAHGSCTDLPPARK